jgi:hypothetical protein
VGGMLGILLGKSTIWARMEGFWKAQCAVLGGCGIIFNFDLVRGKKKKK